MGAHVHTIFFIIISTIVIVIVAFLILTYPVWLTNGHFSSQKYIKENIIVVVFGNASVIDSVRIYLSSYNTNILCKEGQQDVQKLLCEKFLGINKELPVLIFLMNNTLKGVAIGLPSEALWQKIAEQLSRSQSKFLAVSVKEKDLPWHCKLCEVEEDKITEYLRILNNEEETLIISIIKGNNT